METHKSCHYLTVRTNTSGKRVWACLVHNQPVMADNESREVALEVARKYLSSDKLVLLWDGDVGEFTEKVSLR